MTKMAVMPIYCRNPSKFFFSGTEGPIFTKLDLQHRGPLLIIVCLNDDSGMTLTYFTARSNLVTLAFSIGKSENSAEWIFQKLLQPVT